MCISMLALLQNLPGIRGLNVRNSSAPLSNNKCFEILEGHTSNDYVPALVDIETGLAGSVVGV
jgi:hypothetical protein